LSGIEFLPLVAIAVLFWLLIIRPQSRRAKELQRLQSSLSVGDAVMLTSGIYGTVTETADDHLRVEIAEGVTIKVVRGAIGIVEPTTDTRTHAPDEEQELDAPRVDPEEKN
jgi:preprotein translocase subunit YajC